MGSNKICAVLCALAFCSGFFFALDARASDIQHKLQVRCGSEDDGLLDVVMLAAENPNDAGHLQVEGVAGAMSVSKRKIYIYASMDLRSVGTEVEHTLIAVLGRSGERPAFASTSQVLFRTGGALNIDVGGGGVIDPEGLSCSLKPLFAD